MDKKPAPQRKRAATKAELEERRTKALALNVRGRTMERIAEISREEGWLFPYKNRQSVWVDIQTALKESKARRMAAADEWIENEVQKLDAMEAETWRVAEALHLVVNQGEVVFLEPEEISKLKKKQGWAKPVLTPETIAALEDAKGRLEREPLIDNKPVLDCMLVLLKIAERRAKLIGFDAPVKKQVEVIGAGAVGDKIDEIASRILAGQGTLTPALNRIEDLAPGGSGAPASAPEAA